MIFYILIYFNLRDFGVRFLIFVFGFRILFGFTPVGNRGLSLRFEILWLFIFVLISDT